MQVSVEICDHVDIQINLCDRARIDEQFSGLKWKSTGNPPGKFECADLRIGGITIKFFT